MRYVIIGDIHEHTTELQELIAQQRGVIYNKSTNTFECKETRFILVGDYLNKGEPGETHRIIEFIHANRQHFDIVRGNHEWAVWQYLNGLGSPSDPEKFNAIGPLQANCDLYEKFRELYIMSKPFITGPGFIVTHSPCETRFLGKLDKESQMAQMLWKVTDETALHKHLKLLDTTAIPGQRHVFGHVSFKKPFDTGKLVGLDSGASYGNGLSCAIFESESVQLEHYYRIPSQTARLFSIP